jgi:hypothetical protein
MCTISVTSDTSVSAFWQETVETAAAAARMYKYFFMMTEGLESTEIKRVERLCRSARVAITASAYDAFGMDVKNFAQRSLIRRRCDVRKLFSHKAEKYLVITIQCLKTYGMLI